MENGKILLTDLICRSSSNLMEGFFFITARKFLFLFGTLIIIFFVLLNDLDICDIKDCVILKDKAIFWYIVWDLVCSHAKTREISLTYRNWTPSRKVATELLDL